MPSTGPTVLKAAEELGRAFFPIRPYLGSDPRGQRERLFGAGLWRLCLAAGGREPGGTEGEVGG